MTAYAFVDGLTATEIAEGVAYASPIDGELFPAGWHQVASQPEREAKAIYPIVEPSAVAFPNEITAQSLVVSAGPIVTRTNTTAAMSYADQLTYLNGLINETEATKLSTSFPGQDGSGGHVDYALTQTRRDSIAHLGQVAQIASLGRRAFGFIDWNNNDNPANNATITINGATFTFVTSSPTGDQILIGADSVATVGNAIAVLNASTNAAVSCATYYLQGFNKLSVYYKTPGALGNAFTLAVSSSPACNAVRSGATLTGGWDPIEPGKFHWPYHPDDDMNLYEIEDINGNGVNLDAFEFMALVRDLAFFTDFVVTYALNQRQAAATAAAGSDQTGLQTVYDDVTNPTNWDPGTPPTWP